MKRHREDNANEQPEKRQKQEQKKENKNNIAPLKLSDINDLCLGKIFAYLNLEDLLHIAETSVRFVNEAKWAAERKLRGNMIKIDEWSISIAQRQIGWHSELLSSPTSICFVGKPNIVSKFFEYFGQFIIHLELRHEIQVKGLSQLIDKHLENLKHVVLLNIDEIEVGKSKTIRNIAKVTLFEIPKTILLENLKELELLRLGVTIDQVIDFICQNTGLVMLTVMLAFWSTYKLSSDEITKLINKLPNLAELKLENDSISVKGVEQLLVESKSLKKLYLRVYSNPLQEIENFVHYCDANTGTDWSLEIEEDPGWFRTNIMNFTRKQ